MSKINQYFRNEDFIDKESSDQWGGNEETELTKRGCIAEPDISEYLAPEELHPDLSNTENYIFFWGK